MPSSLVWQCPIQRGQSLTPLCAFSQRGNFHFLNSTAPFKDVTYTFTFFFLGFQKDNFHFPVTHTSQGTCARSGVCQETQRWQEVGAVGKTKLLFSSSFQSDILETNLI